MSDDGAVEEGMAGDIWALDGGGRGSGDVDEGLGGAMMVDQGGPTGVLEDCSTCEESEWDFPA